MGRARAEFLSIRRNVQKTHLISSHLISPAPPKEWYNPSGEVKAVCVVTHGIDTHSGRNSYTYVEYLCKAGYAVMSMDLEGHGRTDGVHSYVPDYVEAATDVAEYVRMCKARFPDKKIFIIGHSVG